MPTPKENFENLMRHKNMQWLGDPWSCFCRGQFHPCLVFDPISLRVRNGVKGKTNVKNAWGISFDWPEGQPGATPNITEENKLIKDITEWRSAFREPSLEDLDWSQTYGRLPEPLDRENKLVMTPAFVGMFEFSHMCMGFEDALVNYMTEPEAMKELLSAYTDWKIRAAEIVIDELHPDYIFSHDDWGNKRSLFLPPDTWREIVKPCVARYYKAVKAKGTKIIHHADCVCSEIAEDMAELGIDGWQGVLPENDIRDVCERVGDKMAVIGGIDMARIDFPDAKEEDIRKEVRRAIDEYMPYPGFVPCMTTMRGIYPHVDRIVNDELNRYGAEYAEKHF